MADDKSKRGPADASRISEDYELSYWTRKFGVSPDELRDAIAKVGVSAAVVERALKG